LWTGTGVKRAATTDKFLSRGAKQKLTAQTNEKKKKVFTFSKSGAERLLRGEEEGVWFESRSHVKIERHMSAAAKRSALGLVLYLTVSRDRLELLSGWWDWQAARSGGTVAAAVPPPPPPLPLSASTWLFPSASSWSLLHPRHSAAQGLSTLARLQTNRWVKFESINFGFTFGTAN